MAKRTVIVVQVVRGILWVGGEAYPLHNIARATTIRIEPDRKAAVWRFLRYVLTLAILTVAAVVVSDRVEWPDGDYGKEQDVMRGVTIVVLVLAAAFTIQLLLVLAMRTYYALVIETSGTPRAVLVSADPREVGGLVYQITDAISNPQANFRTEITNYYNSHIGDKINQIGGVGNTGKRVGN
ncbi:DUF6232 family protein [Streptomyces sp. NPDC086554]|uniref:DUF6232 family protein n=1 Tax=Streptomyces sp. NPDC086554 TaxID=3154864 RepID=UPI003429F83D